MTKKDDYSLEQQLKRERKRAIITLIACGLFILLTYLLT